MSGGINGENLCCLIESTDSVAKTQPLFTNAELKRGDRVLREVEKNSFMLCQAKGATAGSCPQKCVSHPGGGSEESYSVQGAGHDQLMDILLIGWW